MENETLKKEGAEEGEKMNVETAAEKTIIVPEVEKTLETPEPVVLLGNTEKNERPVSEMGRASMKPSLWPLLKKMNHKKFYQVVGAVVLVLLVALAYSNKGLLIAAMVNDSPISRLSVIQELEKQSGKQVLEALITKKLIAAEMEKNKIVVKSTVVDGEIKKIETQVATQGGTLEQALSQQGMTLLELREQILIQKELELLLADKTAVTEDEVTAYLKDNKTLPQKGMSSDDLRNQVREQLKGQKFSTEAKAWVEGVKKAAKIDYFVSYEL